MVSWASIQSILLFLGPLLLPRLISWYRNVRTQIRTRGVQRPEPLSPATGVALGILFLAALAALASTLPFFTPENIFLRTSSRLMTSGGVLTTRLAALRPLTPFDARLRTVLDAGGLDARLFYALHGPSVLVDCPLTKSGEPHSDASTLFWYSLPARLTPHILHCIALGIATSATWCGRDGNSWRTYAITAAVILAAAEIWRVATYDVRINARSTRVGDVDYIFWKIRVWRGLAMAGVDGVLGWAIWLQATGRAWWAMAAPSVTERVGEQGRALEEVLMRLKGVGVVANTLRRDATARARTERYWATEAEVMKDVNEHPDVLAAQRSALARLDMARVDREADAFAELVANQVRMATGQPTQTVQ